MRLSYYFLLFCLLSVKLLHSQREANVWYFGYKAGIDFNSGSPVALTDGKMSTDEGCAAISGPSGNILFYTDGIAVWDSDHDTMPNGKDLAGSPSSTQSSVVIQKPGSNNIYFIFTTDAAGGAKGLRYSEINMNLNGGKGDVSQKNVLLFSSSCEKITGIRHCNNTDIWILTQDYIVNSNTLRAFLVTPSGVSTNPVLSNVGAIIDGVTYEYGGQLKASSDGKWIAMASLSKGMQLFDFNSQTGVVSYRLTFDPYLEGNIYGVEFSPDGTLLYASSYDPAGKVYQFNLCAGSDSAIAYSGVIVGYSQHYCGSLQLASDKKIYTARYNANIDSTSWLGVINNPDVLGSGCNYVDNGVSLSGKYSSLGLPNFVPYYLKSQLPPYTFTVSCLNATFSAPTVNKNNCVGSSSAVNSFSWNFGDPASGASNTSTTANTTHTFSSAGTYTVTLTLYYACGYDVITQSVKVNGPSISVTKEQTIQSGDSVTLTATASGVLLWNTGATSASITVSPHVTTAYCVMVNDSVGCTNTVCTRVIVIVPIDIPNVFTPDGDNINDVWNIRGLEAYPDARVSIFNRWGQSILHKSDYQIPWDGKHNGNELPTASYYYVIDLNNGTKQLTGYVTIKR